MAHKVWGLRLLAMVVGLLVLVPETIQLTVDHPLYGLVQRLNNEAGPFLGLIVPSSSRDEKLLTDSGFFVSNPSLPHLTIAGRKFHIGKFRGMPAIYVKAEKPLASIGTTVQILLDTFRIMGVISYGKSGSVTDKLNIPDVAVPASVAYAGVWRWQRYEGSEKVKAAGLPSLRIGDYNVPEPGENRLGSIEFQEVSMYTPSSYKGRTLWFDVYPEWVRIAAEIEGSKLERCINGTLCNDRLPNIIHGLRTASSDILMSNEAYGNFLRDQLDVAAVDTASTAVVQTAIANGMPHIVFRAASNKAGVPYDPEMSATAGRNVLRVVAYFVDRLNQTPNIRTY